jgi:hypothetical protein
VTPRPVIALSAQALAATLDVSRSSRGVLVVVMANVSAILDSWTFTWHPALGLGGSMFLHSTWRSWPHSSDSLSLVGSDREGVIAWRFRCPDPFSQPDPSLHPDGHPVLFLRFDDEEADFQCPKELPQPVSLVPVRWLAFAEPRSEAG